jgi:hypothetical protein
MRWGGNEAEDVLLLSLTVASIRGFHLPFFVSGVLGVSVPGFVICTYLDFRGR